MTFDAGGVMLLGRGVGEWLNVAGGGRAKVVAGWYGL